MRTAFLGIAFVIVGIAIFAITLVQLIRGPALDPQTKVPGTVTAEIDTPGRYYLWDNHWTTFEGKKMKYADDWPNDATVTVRDSNETVLDFVPDSSQSWSIGNSGKTSVGYVDIASKSTIQLDIDNVGHDRIVSVSNRTMKQELWSRLVGFGIGLLVGALGLPTFLLGLYLRSRGSTTLETSAQSSP